MGFSLGKAFSSVLGFDTSPPGAPSMKRQIKYLNESADIMRARGERMTTEGDRIAGDIRQAVSASDPRLAAHEQRFGALSEGMIDDYTDVYAPVGREFATQALDWASPSRQEQNAGRAMADVATQFQSQRSAADRNLQAYGIDPTSGRSQGLQTAWGTAEGAARAGAANTARMQTEMAGMGYMNQAAQLGLNVNQLGQGAGQTSANMSQARIANQLAGAQGQTAAMNMGLPWYAQGNASATGATGAMANQYAGRMNEFSASNAATGAGLNILAQGAGAYFGGAPGAAVGGAAAGALNPVSGSSPGGYTPALTGGFNDGGAIPYAYGGAVPGYNDGGAIPVAGAQVMGPGDGTSDSIPAVIDGQQPAALSSGEYVIPADVVMRKGTEFFDKLVEQNHVPAAIQEQQNASQ